MELPLFPLNSVLFPGATLPIHIFEERYKLMIRWCLDNTSLFGVLLIRSGEEVAGLADTAAALFAEHYRLYLAASNQWTRQVGMPGDPGALADFVASRLAVSRWAKQRLLEELSVRARLSMEVDVLGDAIREMTPRLMAVRAGRWRGFGATN